MQALKFKNIEFSEVNFYELSGKMRIDSEHYQPEYINIEKQVRQKEHKPLAHFQTSIIHPTEIKREYEDEGVTFLRTQNVRPLNVDFGSSEVFISRTDANKLKALQYGDVLMTRTGANFGDTAVYLNQRERVIASSHVLLIRSVGLNQHYLGVFLNSKYGRKLIDKGMYGGLQPEIAPSYLYGLPIPIPSDAFQTRFEGLLLQAYELQRHSERLYQDAEKLLLDELGLGDWKPKMRSFTQMGINMEVEDTVRAVKLSEIETFFRLDSEHWKPNLLAVEAKIQKYGYSTLGVYCLSVIRGVQPKFVDGGNVFVIASKAVRPARIRVDASESTDQAFYHKANVARARVKKGDVLLNGTGVGTLGRAGIYDREEPAVADNHVTILRLKDSLNPYFLMLFLNSLPGQAQSERWQTGSSGQLELYPNQIERFLIPDISSEMQASIGEMIQGSYQTRDKSKHLLALAKQAVERYIEEDEAAATALIDSNL